MIRRTAHRPRYRNTEYLLQPSLKARDKAYNRTRWFYRKQRPILEKHAPGHSLALFPLTYRLMRSVIVYH